VSPTGRCPIIRLVQARTLADNKPIHDEQNHEPDLDREPDQELDQEPVTDTGQHEPPTGTPEREHSRLHMFLFGSALRIGLSVGALFCVIGIVAAIIIANNGSSPPRVVVVDGKSTPSALPSAPSPPRSISSSADLQQYVLSQPIWQRTPTTFSEALGTAFNDQAVSIGYAQVQVDAGVPIAHSVSDLIDNGASLEGDPVFVVGRVVSSVVSAVSAYTWTTGSVYDTVVKGPRGTGRIYVLASSGDDVGQVVFFPAVVVAVGLSTTGPTAYLVSLDDPAPADQYGTTVGDSVPGLARQFR
jgi:hypothetical protein